LNSKEVKKENDLLEFTDEPFILKVPYKSSALEIRFYANDIYKGGKATYRYLVNGENQGWSNYESEGIIKVIAWSPGIYNVTLQGKNLSSGKFYESKKLIIQILPPFWATLWFRLVTFLLFFAGLYFVIKRRGRRIRREEQEKKELQQKILETKMEADESTFYF
jgi:hypothetical protein